MHRVLALAESARRSLRLSQTLRFLFVFYCLVCFLETLKAVALEEELFPAFLVVVVLELQLPLLTACISVSLLLFFRGDESGTRGRDAPATRPEPDGADVLDAFRSARRLTYCGCRPPAATSFLVKTTRRGKRFTRRSSSLSCIDAHAGVCVCGGGGDSNVAAQKIVLRTRNLGVADGFRRPRCAKTDVSVAARGCSVNQAAKVPPLVSHLTFFCFACFSFLHLPLSF